MDMPVLFISHGAPDVLLEAGQTINAWRNISAQLPRPAAILVVSAHWETSIPTVSSAQQPVTIHDFGGFSEALYRIRYPSPGAPALANQVAQQLTKAGIPVVLDQMRGLDHGAWIPLSVMFPDADIPVVQLSIQPDRDPVWHLALGRALRPLSDEGVLILASGSITHNLPAIFRHPAGSPVPTWVSEFCTSIAASIRAGDIEALVAYRKLATHALQNHPADEHLLPLFVALGAAKDIVRSQHLNRIVTHGMLAMDAWLFEG